MDALPSGGEISVRLVSDAQSVRLVVSQPGALDEQVSAKLFEPFIHRAARRPEGRAPATLRVRAEVGQAEEHDPADEGHDERARQGEGGDHPPLAEHHLTTTDRGASAPRGSERERREQRIREPERFAQPGGHAGAETELPCARGDIVSGIRKAITAFAASRPTIVQFATE